MPKQIKIMTAVSWILLSTMVLPRPAMAAEGPELIEGVPRIVISEVNWAGSELSNADEWLELQSLEEEAIDLTGWSIEGAATSGGTLIIPDGTTIEPHSTLLISNYAQDQSTLAIEPTIITTAVSLGNSSLRLVLRDGSGTPIDALRDGGAPAAGSNGELGFASMVRRGTLLVSADASVNFDDGVVQLGTPGVGDMDLPSQPPPSLPLETGEEMTSPAEDIGAAPASVETPADEQELPVEGAEAETLVEEDAADETLDAVEPIESVEPVEEVEPIVTAPIAYVEGILIISEVHPNPTEGNEWVEIYNPSEDVIPLEGWRVAEAGGQSVALDGYLGFGQFTTIEFVSRLNNDGDTLRLLDAAGNIIDTLTYGQEVKVGMSAARDQNGKVVVTITPTRYGANVITEVVKEEPKLTKQKSGEESGKQKVESGDTPETGPTTLRLVSVLPDPVGDDADGEEIIVENFGEENVVLDGWVLTDGSRSFELQGELAPGLRLVLPRTATKIALNNLSDTLSLIAPDDETIDQTTYENAKEGARYARADAGWLWPELPSESQPEDVPTVVCPETLDDAALDESQTNRPRSSSGLKKTKKSSALQTIEGVVIAEPGIFGSQIMYLDGQQLYQYYGDFPPLGIGDLIRATGTPSTNHGEPRLKLASAEAITIIGSQEVVAAGIAIDQAADFIGRLVQISGTIVGRGGGRLQIEDDSEELTVIIKDGTEISLTELELGEAVAITGIIGNYDGRLRIMPRSEEDIQEVAAEPVEEVIVSGLVESTKFPTGTTTGLALTGLTTTAILGRAWQFYRHKKIAALIPRAA